MDRQAAQNNVEGIILGWERAHVAGSDVYAIGDALQLCIASGDLERVPRLIRRLPQVDADCATTRQQLCHHEKDGSAPAAKIQDALVAPQVELQQELPPNGELPDSRGVEVVGHARGQREPDVQGGCGNRGSRDRRTDEEDGDRSDRASSHPER